MEMFSVMEMTSKDVAYLYKEDLRLLQDENFNEFSLWLVDQGEIGFDIESSGLSPLFNIIAGYVIGTKETAWYAPVAHSLGMNISKENQVKLLELVSLKECVTHNGKFDWKFVSTETGFSINIVDDTFTMMSLLDSSRINRRGLGLKSLVKEFLHVDMLELKDDLGTYDFTTVDVSNGDAMYYACPDTLNLMRLRDVLKPKIIAEGLSGVYQLEMDILIPIARMEQNGVLLDVDFLEKETAKIEPQLAKIKSDIASLVGSSYDIDSPAQLSALLYTELKLTPPSETTSTEVKILSRMKSQHAIIPMLIKYSELYTSLHTYYKKLPTVIAEDGRLHTDFNSLGTRSGRFSSSGGIGKGGKKVKINMQNLPNGPIRSAFIPREGYYWLRSDYSQLEYRVMVSLAGELAMVQAFIDGVDFHVKTASVFLNKSPEDIVKAERKKGKTLNFAVTYGMSKYGLANLLDCDVKEAEEAMKKYFSSLKKLSKLIDSIKLGARRTGEVRTYFGRRRLYPEILACSDPSEIDGLLRSTFNTYVQGTAADLCKVGIRSTFTNIDASGLDISCVLQVHDELNFEVHKSIPPYEAVKLIGESMNVDMSKDKNISWAPIVADVEIGTCFGDTIDVFVSDLEANKEEDFESVYAKLKASSAEEHHPDDDAVDAVVEQESSYAEKPSVIIEGNFTKRKLEFLRTLSNKNSGNYKIYLLVDEGYFEVSSSNKINPTAIVINALREEGLTITVVSDKAKELDVDSLFKSRG